MTKENKSCAFNSQQDQHQQQAIEIKERLRHIKNKILVMSGKGGVGKSSVAAYLSVTLAKRGYKVGLMDVDLHGPSIPRMLGLKGNIGPGTQSGKAHPVMHLPNLEVMSIEPLMGENKDAATIWRGPLKIGVIRQFIADIEWMDLDYMIIDSPPGTGDEPLTVAQTIPDAKALIVTTPQEISLADVRKSISFCRQVHMEILGLVENMSGLICPHCGKTVERYRNPFPTVDFVIQIERGGIILIKRKNPPYGWALPGGFVDYGESLEEAALREAKEETSLDVELLAQLGAYSDPERDPRQHTITVVFAAKAKGRPIASDDAAEIGVFGPDTMPDKLAFDHRRILKDYYENWFAKR